ncbi:MAG: hypothetical protein CL610_15900 [Anaerolineaceae bacterium]|nr:hypothetical protein [Anaerolineaceae bacterium]
MCLFCTAVPMTIALGARTHAKHIERRKAAEARGEPPPKMVSVRAIQTATAVVALGLGVGAVVYHTSLSTQGVT